MSAESLLFLAIFVLLPLIERVLEEVRKRQRPGPPPPPDADAPPPQTPRRRAPRAEPAPEPPRPTPRPVPAPPPIPVETRIPDVPRAPRQDRPRAPQAPRPVPPAPLPTPMPRPVPAPARMAARDVLNLLNSRDRQAPTLSASTAQATARQRSRRAVVRILKNPRAVRRAVLVSAVLGPCKALESEPR